MIQASLIPHAYSGETLGSTRLCVDSHSMQQLVVYVPCLKKCSKPAELVKCFCFCGTVHLRNNLHFLGPGVVGPQNADDCEFGVPWLDFVHLQFNYGSYVV